MASVKLSVEAIPHARVRTTTQAPTLISIATFASMGGFSRSTARRLVASGAISAVRVGRKTLRVPLEEAQRLLPAEPKRGRGRPPRGEASKPINVRLSTSERAAIEAIARKEKVAVSALLRRVALVFALDEHARAQIKGSVQWPR